MNCISLKGIVYFTVFLLSLPASATCFSIVCDCGLNEYSKLSEVAGSAPSLEGAYNSARGNCAQNNYSKSNSNSNMCNKYGGRWCNPSVYRYVIKNCKDPIITDNECSGGSWSFFGGGGNNHDYSNQGADH